MTIYSAYTHQQAMFESYKDPSSCIFLAKNTESKAIAVCNQFSSNAGYRNPIDFLGKDDHQIKSAAANLAETFILQDKTALKHNQKKFYLLTTTNAHKQLEIMLFTKTPYRTFTICEGWTLSHGLLFNYLYQAIQAIETRFRNRINLCFELVDTYNELTQRETEVMFFLLRSQSSTAIANILGLATRTVQHYIENIKIKLGCDSTQQLIEAALYLKFNEGIPKSLLPKEALASAYASGHSKQLPYSDRYEALA